MADTARTYPEAPAHVPPGLIRIFDTNADPDYERDAFGVLAKLKDYPPLFYNPASPFGTRQGSWVVTSAKYVREVLQNADPFTTTERYAGDEVHWPRRLLPLQLDPPQHNKYRALIAPIFAPKSIDRLEAHVKQVADELIDSLKHKGECEFMHEFARVFPSTIFMLLMGLPMDMKDQFFEWEETFFHGGTPEEKRQVGFQIFDYLNQLIKARRQEPKEDLISLLVQAKLDGQSLSEEDIQDFCFLLYIAGLDTVNAGLGHTFRWLAQHPETQGKLREDPGLVPGFVEEMLRWNAWVHVTRVLAHDHDFHGIAMKEGDRVDCLVTPASHDPEEFENPETVDIRREPNTHFAFGGGPHRCAGSHLARRELRVAVTEWLQRIPEFRIKEGEDIRYFRDGMLALQRLPLAWDVSKVKGG